MRLDGHILDVFPDERNDLMVLWIRTASGVERVVDTFWPTFNVVAPLDDLRNLGRRMEALPAVRGEVVRGGVTGYHFYPTRDQVLAWLSEADWRLIDEGFNAIQIIGIHLGKVSEVEPKPVPFNQRPGLFHVIAEDLPQGGMKDMGCGMVASGLSSGKTIHCEGNSGSLIYRPGPDGAPVDAPELSAHSKSASAPHLEHELIGDPGSRLLHRDHL